MDRTALVALRLLAGASIACGPGEHAQQGNFGDLFGRGGAGKGTQEVADGSPIETGAIDDAIQGPAPLGSGGAGSRATPPITSMSTGSPPSAGSQATVGGAGAMVPSAAAAGQAAPQTSDAGMSCPAGQVFVSGQCACDLNGTFALHGKVSAAIEDMAPIEALNDTVDLWGIVRYAYDADGSLAVTLTACGQTTPDICAATQAPIVLSPEAYAQYVPVEVWERQGVDTTARLNLPAVVPGAAFDTPTLVQLFGVALANPLGAWPSSRNDVEGGPDYDGSAVNGARWVDLDGDGNLGLTIRAVGPGGAPATDTSGPPRSYGAMSEKCPRTDPGAARSAYAYLPMSQGLGVRRIKDFYAAQRVALELHGTLESCDRVTGRLTGPRAGNLRLDAVIGGCAIASGTSESPCGAALLDATEASGGGSSGLIELGTGEFVLSRLPNDATCAQVRAINLK